MLIAKLDGSVAGEHQQLFPHTHEAASGPSDDWLEENGFVRVPKSADDLAAEIRICWRWHSRRNRIFRNIKGKTHYGSTQKNSFLCVLKR